MRDAKGTVVYQIEEDGCLNGLYRNEDQPQKTYNEIARQTECTDDTDALVGSYIASWIDIDDTVKVGTLIITKDKKDYDLVWSIDDKPVYKGKGKLTGANQLTASFATAR
ncbi:MAG: hypothetical protein R2800_02020 [Flavipsychrobacter sp.]